MRKKPNIYGIGVGILSESMTLDPRSDTARALHDWVAFGFPYHTKPGTLSPVRRKHMDTLTMLGMVDRNGPTDKGRRWVSDNLQKMI